MHTPDRIVELFGVPRRNCVRVVLAKLEEVEAALARGYSGSQIARTLQMKNQTFYAALRRAREQRDAARAA